jgi:hypothetical protein
VSGNHHNKGNDMKNHHTARAVAALALTFAFAIPATAQRGIVDGVALEEDRSRAPEPMALTPGSIDFDTPALFSDSLPLQVFQTVRTGALFFGKGVVLDAASFEVTGTSGTSVLAFNGRTAVNGDGSIPGLPETILFLKPNGLGVSRKQTVSVNVASKRDEGRTVRLRAFNLLLRVVASDSLILTPEMQTLRVSTPTPEIVFVTLSGERDLEVLAVDNLVYN